MQFVRKMWPIQLAFRLHCSLTLSNTSSFLTWEIKTYYLESSTVYINVKNLLKPWVLLSVILYNGSCVMI